jgi:heme a synthase
MVLLSLLLMQSLQTGAFERLGIPSQGRSWSLLVFVCLVVQVFLGAWVSTNYAVLACDAFPLCHASEGVTWDFSGFVLWRSLGVDVSGAYLSVHALALIHWVHRLVALGVVSLLLLLCWKLRDWQANGFHWRWLLLLICTQVLSGVSNVVLGWPMWAALIHSACASLLWITLLGWGVGVRH